MVPAIVLANVAAVPIQEITQQVLHHHLSSARKYIFVNETSNDTNVEIRNNQIHYYLR